MLWLVFMILMIMWLIGFIGDYTFNGLLHLLLVAAIAAVIIRVFGGRRPIL